MLTVKYTNLFKKDYKLMKKRGYDLKLLQEVVNLLANNQVLPEKYKDHSLVGEYKLNFFMQWKVVHSIA